MSKLHEIVSPTNPTKIVDVGASPIDGPPPYKAMLDAGLCLVTGFEPNVSALDLLQKRSSRKESYHPQAVGNGETITIHEYEAPGLNSALELDPARLACFTGFTKYGVPTGSKELATFRLENLVRGFDFLKIDVQGYELKVFEGAGRLLNDAVAVQTEVSFVPLYKEQPTFADVDSDLRARGFIAHRFMAVKNWMLAPLAAPGKPHAFCNQLLEADVVYVKDFCRMDLLSSEQLRQMAMLAHYVFESPDLVVRCLHTLAAQQSVAADAIAAYLATINH